MKHVEQHHLDCFDILIMILLWYWWSLLAKRSLIAHIYMIKWPYCSLMTQRNTYSLMKFMLQITSFKLYVNEIPFRTTDNKPTYVLGCGSLLIDTTTVWVCSVLDYSLRSNLCLWHLVLTKTRWLQPNCATRGFRMVVHKPNHSDHVYFYTQSLDQRHKMISDKITLLFFPPRIRDTHSKLCLNRIKCSKPTAISIWCRNMNIYCGVLIHLWRNVWKHVICTNDYFVHLFSSMVKVTKSDMFS